MEAFFLFMSMRFDGKKIPIYVYSVLQCGMCLISECNLGGSPVHITEFPRLTTLPPPPPLITLPNPPLAPPFLSRPPPVISHLHRLFLYEEQLFHTVLLRNKISSSIIFRNLLIKESDVHLVLREWSSKLYSLGRPGSLE